jgi:Integrase core domain/GAG-pre-integrase domain
VKLQTHYQGKTHNIKLKDILYVPGNRNNLLSLGQWVRAGNQFTRGTEIHLFTKDGICIASRPLSSTNLYHIKCKIPHLVNEQQTWQYALNSTSAPPDWEIWHWRFGHVSYDGLTKLLACNLAEGFTVNHASPKPDCIACIEAKQSEKPFGRSMTRETHPGKLTHMDLWGKYEVVSINGAHYYLLMVDNASRHTMVMFLKSKDQAAQRVKDYLTHIIVRNKVPNAIRIDRGTKFANADLKSWCACHGIDIQMTAPYSPSQNGVAECMNRTLVELARAMLIAANLPEFLWEPAVEHAAYIRKCAYTSTTNCTPYQAWNGRKPDVSHLREFGVPVWTLLQGQKVQ